MDSRAGDGTTVRFQCLQIEEFMTKIAIVEDTASSRKLAEFVQADSEFESCARAGRRRRR